jgi:hypothetical protein
LYISIWAICTCLPLWICMWMLSHPPVGPSLVVNWSIRQWCAFRHWSNLTSVMQLLLFMLIVLTRLVRCRVSIPPRHQGPIQCLSTTHAKMNHITSLLEFCADRSDGKATDRMIYSILCTSLICCWLSFWKGAARITWGEQHPKGDRGLEILSKDITQIPLLCSPQTHLTRLTACA